MKILDYLRAFVWFFRRLSVARRLGIDPTRPSFEWWVEQEQKARDEIFRYAVAAHHFASFIDAMLGESLKKYITKMADEAAVESAISAVSFFGKSPAKFRRTK